MEFNKYDYQDDYHQYQENYSDNSDNFEKQTNINWEFLEDDTLNDLILILEEYLEVDPRFKYIYIVDLFKNYKISNFELSNINYNDDPVLYNFATDIYNYLNDIYIYIDKKIKTAYDSKNLLHDEYITKFNESEEGQIASPFINEYLKFEFNDIYIKIYLKLNHVF